jgi:DNA repair protein RadC
MSYFGLMNVRLTKEQKIKIANSEDVFTIMRAVLMRQNKLRRQKEYFWAMGLNSWHEISYIELITIGTLNMNIVDPVELFSFAVQKKCKKLILIHNHPSGRVKPSESDVKLTYSLVQGGLTLKIQILDHIIISEKKYFSFTENDLL